MNKMTRVEEKKRKVIDPETEDEIPTLGTAWESMKDDGPLLFKSMDEYLDDVIKNKGDVTEMLVAQYFRAAELENKFFVPTEFQAFNIERNSKGEVTCIVDSQNNALGNKGLARVMAYDAMRSRGIAKVVMNATNDGSVEALTIPEAVQIVKEHTAKDAKNFQNEVRAVYTRRYRVIVFATTANIIDTLKLGFVTMSEIGNVLKTLNSVESREDCSDLNVGELDSVDSINKVISALTAKQTRKSFLQALLVAKIEKLSTEDRLEVFSNDATYNLANLLKLRLPHKGPCYTKLGNKKLTTVDLETLGDDVDVLMSNNIMSMREFKELAGNTSKYPVYVNDDNLGGKKGSKWAKMSVKSTMRVKDVATMLTAISAANNLDRKPSSANTVVDTKAKNVTFLELE